MTSGKKRYLHRHLLVSFFRVALLFMVLNSLFYFALEFGRASSKSRLMLNQLLDTVESTAAIAAYSGNRAIGEDVLQGLLRNDVVHEVRLQSDLGLALNQTRPRGSSAGDEVVRTLRSPFGAGEPIGTLVLVPEERFILHEARYGALMGALNSAAVIALTTVILLILVRSSLSRPLLKVSNTLHAIKAGEKERLEPLPGHRNDELGQLVEDINALLDTVQDQFSQEQRLRQEIQAVERQLRGIFETTSAGIFVLDGSGRLRTANPTLGRVLGLDSSALEAGLGRDFPAAAFAESDRFHEIMRQAGQTAQTVAADLRLPGRGDAPPAWVHCLLSRHVDGSGADRYEGVVYDITERRELELRFRHEADHDSLTGLYRRQAAERELAKLLDQARGAENPPAVMLLDLDNFKYVNDNHGHAAGDAVLVETARRLRSCVRSKDIVARLGGDEFAIVLVNCVPLERARSIARAIVAEVTRPIPLGAGRTARIGISIGIAIHGPRLPAMAALFEAADLAMYEVKRQGKNGFGMANPDGAVAVEQMEIDRTWGAVVEG
jgi:diguanylate cyclase (GGDEF)-like protein/PAS domain S-box-containing protein